MPAGEHRGDPEGDRVAFGEPGGAAGDDDVLAAERVGAVGHSARSHGIGDEADPLCANKIEEHPHSGGSKMDTVTDHLQNRLTTGASACLAAGARGEAVLEVIGDGVHLAPATVRMLFDVVGAQGIALITDSMAASGMPEGTYTLGGQDVVVSGRTARLAGGNSIAGGVATLLDVVRWCVQCAGIPLLEAVTAASATPSQALALPGVGALQAGYGADVVVVDDELSLRGVLRRGQWLTIKA